MNNVEAIVKHPAVSRVYANSPRIELLTNNIALRALCRLRRMRRDAKRALQNAREDVAVASFTDSAASMPPRREQAQLRVAHENAALLPAGLAAFVAAASAGRGLVGKTAVLGPCERGGETVDKSIEATSQKELPGRQPTDRRYTRSLCGRVFQEVPMRQLRFACILACSAFVFLAPALKAQFMGGGIKGVDWVGTVQKRPYTATWTQKSLRNGTLSEEFVGPAQQSSAQQPPVQQAPVQGGAASPEIITSVTLESVQRIIQGLGFDCSRVEGSNGQPDYLVFMGAGYKIVARVPSPAFIQLVNVFTDKGVPLEAINKWNLSHSFNKASIGDNGPLFLQTEIIVTGGVTKANIEGQIKEFRDSVASWARFVLDNKVPTPPK